MKTHMHYNIWSGDWISQLPCSKPGLYNYFRLRSRHIVFCCACGSHIAATILSRAINDECSPLGFCCWLMLNPSFHYLQFWGLHFGFLMSSLSVCTTLNIGAMGNRSTVAVETLTYALHNRVDKIYHTNFYMLQQSIEKTILAHSSRFLYITESIIQRYAVIYDTGSKIPTLHSDYRANFDFSNSLKFKCQCCALFWFVLQNSALRDFIYNTTL